MAQQYPDSVDEYPADCNTLIDLGFQIIPYIGPHASLGINFDAIADMWVIVSLVAGVLMMLVAFERPQLIARRLLLIYGSVFALRGFTVMATVYPRLPFKLENFQSSNVLWGSFLILAGVRTTAKDMMFSGHTAGFILMASFVSRYSRSALLSAFFWVFNVLGCIALIAVREHYTADVIVSVIVTRCIFSIYHLYFDSEYVRHWKPGLELVFTRPTTFKAPLQLTDATGTKYELQILGASRLARIYSEKELDNMHRVGWGLIPPTAGETILVHEHGSTCAPSEVVVINTWKRTSWARFRYFSWLKWLDAE